MIGELLKDWGGSVSIDDKHYTSVQDVTSDFKTLLADSHIILHSATERVTEKRQEASSTIVEDNTDSVQYKITVKRYMTEPASPGFDFMAKWNNNIPMPLRTMTGTMEKETRGMVYMRLHGQAEPVVRCMRCGRTLTNPISKHYGIGPECITKIPILMNLDISDEAEIKKKLVGVKWEGWVIKSAITEKEAV